VDEKCPVILPKYRLIVTFKDFLHALKLRHGTDGFTSPPKESVLRIFFRPKNPTASAWCEPGNLGTKGQHATCRPPEPLYDLINDARNCEVRILYLVTHLPRKYTSLNPVINP
jgi:hypothetical protein